MGEAGPDSPKVDLKIKPYISEGKDAINLLDDDDESEIDENELLNEPLKLITRGVELKVQSVLLRENKPAVCLVPYKFKSYDEIVASKINAQHEELFK